MEPEGADDGSTLASFESFLTLPLEEYGADGPNLPQPVTSSPSTEAMATYEEDSLFALGEGSRLFPSNSPGSPLSLPNEDDSRVDDIAPHSSKDAGEMNQLVSAFLSGSPKSVSGNPPLSSPNDLEVANAQNFPFEPPQLPAELRDGTEQSAMQSRELITSNVTPVADADTAMADESPSPSNFVRDNARVFNEGNVAPVDDAEREYVPSANYSSVNAEQNTGKVSVAAKSSASPVEDVPVDQEQVAPLGDNQLLVPTSASSPSSGNDIRAQHQISSIQDAAIGSRPSPLVPTEPTVNRKEEQESDSLRAYPGATGLSSNDQQPSAALALDGANGAQSHSALLVPAEVVEDHTDFELQPAKRAKTNKMAYTGTDAVSVMLGQTAEMILVLAGMSQMRAGRTSTAYEKELAAIAYENLGVLVSQVAPSNLVVRESLESMMQDLNAKRLAQKEREDQAWINAVTEAEELANARAKAKAEAEAEAAAKAQAEAEELERRRKVAQQAVTLGANGSGNNNVVSSTGHPVYMQPPPSPPVAGQNSVLPNQLNSQQQVSVSNAGGAPRLATPVKVASLTGQSPTPPPPKVHPGRPPKVRNRARKDPATVALSTPDYLSQVQNQTVDSQKVQMTHKQLCLGVQQFIRDHVPPVSQTQQALPPTYISTPFPCQVCKIIAEDTTSVLVCDSCDKVTHVKCVQPPPPKSTAKNDWNCRACLIASRGSKYPSKYGPVRRGSPNSVKLWPPHDKPNSNTKPAAAVSNGSFGALLSTASTRKTTNSGTVSSQRKSGLEIDTNGQESGHEHTGGNVGNSPHLVVHLVNEPSPKPNAVSKTSHVLRGHDKKSLHPSPGLRPSVQELAGSKNHSGVVPMEDRQQEQGGSLIQTPSQSDMRSASEAQHMSSKEVEENKGQSTSRIAKEAGREQRQSGAVPVHTDKSRKGTQVNDSNERNIRSGSNIAGKQGDIPLPIVMEWIGASLRRADGKVYYRACRVGGITFSISDCALFRPETADVPPYIARLQVLWEDVETSHKWVRVSWCYYPTDIPLLMGRPGTTVPDEVYESNHCDNNLLGSIQGPCFVLPPLKFREEKERRNALRNGGNVDDLPPIFLSRYLYDAPKGIFRPLQE